MTGSPGMSAFAQGIPVRTCVGTYVRWRHPNASPAARIIERHVEIGMTNGISGVINVVEIGHVYRTRMREYTSALSIAGSSTATHATWQDEHTFLEHRVGRRSNRITCTSRGVHRRRAGVVVIGACMTGGQCEARVAEAGYVRLTIIIVGRGRFLYRTNVDFDKARIPRTDVRLCTHRAYARMPVCTHAAYARTSIECSMVSG